MLLTMFGTPYSVLGSVMHKKQTRPLVFNISQLPVYFLFPNGVIPGQLIRNYEGLEAF